MLLTSLSIVSLSERRTKSRGGLPSSALPSLAVLYPHKGGSSSAGVSTDLTNATSLTPPPPPPAHTLYLDVDTLVWQAVLSVQGGQKY